MDISFSEQKNLHQNMAYFRRYLEKRVRYFNFLPDQSALFSFLTTILELFYLPHFAQDTFPAVRHLVNFYISLILTFIIYLEANRRATTIFMKLQQNPQTHKSVMYSYYFIQKF